VADEGAQSATETARGTVERIEPTKAQRAVARRVAESKATAPHLYLDAEVRVERCDAALAVRAAALALRQHPRLNGAYRDGAFETYSRVNVGVAVPGAEAPVVPTIFDADAKDEDAIREELEGLAARALSAELTSPELAGGTFTVVMAASGSIRAIAPILNLGQAGTLAIGPVTERALVRDGAVVAACALTATLACDARIVGVDEGAEFLGRVRQFLEQPAGAA
jgi:pyruvate dehydrogenase E2 component (dihydrolipoamide acetyltransferase)